MQQPNTKLSKRNYCEMHHFPNINPVKRSINERSPQNERVSARKCEENTEKPANFCKKSWNFSENSEKYLENCSKNSENLEKSEVLALKLENAAIKREFLVKEREYLAQIRAFSQKNAEIQQKYQVLQQFVRELLAEKDEFSNKREILKENTQELNKTREKPQKNVSFSEFLQKNCEFLQ